MAVPAAIDLLALAVVIQTRSRELVNRWPGRIVARICWSWTPGAKQWWWGEDPPAPVAPKKAKSQ